MVWKIAEPGPAFVHRYNDYSKHATIRTDLMVRIAQYLKDMNQGNDPYDPSIAYKSVIKSGIIEVTDGEMKESSDRIYVYPDRHHAMLHLLTIGNDSTREFDITCCEMLIQRLRGADSATTT